MALATTLKMNKRVLMPLRNFSLVVLLFLAAQLQSQPLDWPSFRSQVLENHPSARQAGLYRDQASAALLRAKGGFDPKAYADFSAKNFNDKTYFQHTEAGLKWPTWLGLEVKGAFNYATGDYLNPEATLPADGQANFGLNWSWDKGFS
jgi:outer membrane protein TolC